jgi:hypothetical protein
MTSSLALTAALTLFVVVLGLFQLLTEAVRGLRRGRGGLLENRRGLLLRTLDSIHFDFLSWLLVPFYGCVIVIGAVIGGYPFRSPTSEMLIQWVPLIGVLLSIAALLQSKGLIARAVGIYPLVFWTALFALWSGWTPYCHGSPHNAELGIRPRPLTPYYP